MCEADTPEVSVSCAVSGLDMTHDLLYLSYTYILVIFSLLESDKDVFGLHFKRYKRFPAHYSSIKTGQEMQMCYTS